MSKRNQHTVFAALKRFNYFTYFWKGFRVVALIPIMKWIGVHKMIVIDENDNYHILEPYINHLSLTREESLKPKVLVKIYIPTDGTPITDKLIETLEK